VHRRFLAEAVEAGQQLVDHLHPSIAGLIGDLGISTIFLTKPDRNMLIKVEGKVEEDHVESWPLKDEGHDLVKFRLSATIQE